MKQLSWQRGQMVCGFDELSHNILHNRILKTTLEDLWHAEGIGCETRDLIHRQLEALRQVDRVFITSGLFRRVHLHRNNRFYRFLLNVCELLPVMNTDVSLWSAERSIILDCKFYKEAMNGWHGGEKIHAANLYQLYSYLRNAERREGWEQSEGILLYPAVSDSFSHEFKIEGHRIRVVSVDLDRPWTGIHKRLLELLQ